MRKEQLVGLVVALVGATGLFLALDSTGTHAATIPAASVAALAHDQVKATGFTAIGSCVATVPLNAATTVSAIIATAVCDTATGTGAAPSDCFKLANPSTDLVCIGNANVDAAATAGSDCWPVCRAGAFCAEDVTSMPYKISGTYVNAPANTVVALLLGNGC